MLKRIVIGLFALAISTLAFATNDNNLKQPSKDYFSGFYLGLGIGLHSIHGVTDSTYQLGSDSYKIKWSYSSVGVATTTYAGYGAVFQHNWYIGAEAYFHITPLNTSKSKSSDGIDNRLSIQSTGGIGLALRGGYLFTPRMVLYGLLAADYGGTTVKVKAGQSENKFDKPYFPLVPGIGFEMMLTNKLGFRVQETLYFYNSDTESNSALKTKLNTMVANIATFSLQYHFNAI